MLQLAYCLQSPSVEQCNEVATPDSPAVSHSVTFVVCHLLQIPYDSLKHYANPNAIETCSNGRLAVKRCLLDAS